MENMYKEYLQKAADSNNKGKFEEALRYASQAYDLVKDSYPKNYKALVQKKRSLEGLCRSEEAGEVSKEIKSLLFWNDTKKKAEGEARKKHHLTKSLIKK